MIRLAVAGAAGRMGRAILSLAAKDPDFKIVAGLELPENPLLGTDIGTMLGTKPLGASILMDSFQVTEAADVLIDFTHPSAVETHLKAVLKSKTGLVLGTTGLETSLMEGLAEASKKIPIVQSPNMSVGVNLLLKLVETTALALDESYDIEISEIHHRMKKDAPSGTALKLLEVAAKARNKDMKKDTISGRQGEVGARPRGELGCFALRGGDVIGEHTVFFFGDGERIELTHKASSRDAFAQGALRAAKFLAGKKKGLFNMQDVLGLNS